MKYTTDATIKLDLFQQMSRLSLENIPKTIETSQDERQIHDTL